MEAIDAKVEVARLSIRSSVEAARAQMESSMAEATQQIVEQLTGLKVDPEEAAEAFATELARAGETRRVEQPPVERRPEQVV
jgi:hypothetical protein